MKKKISVRFEVLHFEEDCDMESLINSVKKDLDIMNFYSENNYKVYFVGVIE